MSSLWVCVPVLRRYDLLTQLYESLRTSTVKVAGVMVMDNGQHHPQCDRPHCPVSVMTPADPLGVAASWNVFIRNTTGWRLIVNDDIVFHPDTIERMASIEGAFVSPIGRVNAFSCFLLRDECVEKVGYFDETISPGYGYFEDSDYYMRMRLAGIPITGVPGCDVTHGQSQTLAAATKAEINDHHRRFLLAQSNYLKKWGGLPDHETFTEPYGGKS